MITVLVFSVATTPSCTVDKTTAEASMSVTYTCSARPVCGSISLTIEDNGNTKATGSGSYVTWTTTASNVANSATTCMSTVKCPSVTAIGELIAF